MRLNKKGCAPKEDVCMEHCSTLLCRHGCEDAIPHACDDELPFGEKETRPWKMWKLTGRPNTGVEIHGSGFVEAICPHGTGHHRGVHGCDGCCSLPEAKKIMLKTTKE